MQPSQGLGVVSVHQLADLAAQPGPPLLLDVREPWEVALARIEHAGLETLQVPMGQVPERLEEIAARADAQPVVVYCHHGMRSLQVVAFLSRHGIDVVYNLAGGIDAWSREIDPSVPMY